MRETELDPSTSPSASFGAQLRSLRRAKGLSQVRLGILIRFSDSFISCVERGERNPTLVLAQRSDVVLETGGTLEAAWWQIKHTSLVEGFPEYAAEETRAVELRLFELGLIPGLFQTEEYAAALAAADVKRGAITRAQAEERVSYVLARQQVLSKATSPLVYAVLDESCLRRQVGGAAVMDSQLAHLESLTDKPRMIIQVAPFSMGARCPFAVNVYLATLPNRNALGYTEAQGRGFLTRDKEIVEEWARAYDWLQVGALSDVASINAIRDLRKEPRP